MRTVILAGGYGKRLWPITHDRPKPLLPVVGRPILDYIMDQLPGPGRPILAVNRRFEAQFASWAKGRAVDVVVEPSASEEEKLGSVGALAYLVDRLHLDDDLLVIGGDNLLSLSLADFRRAFRGQTLVALYDLKRPDLVRRRYGVAVVEGNRVVSFQEKPDRPCSTLVSAACFLFPRAILPLFGAFVDQAVGHQDSPGYFLEWLLFQHPVEAFLFEGEWFDIGSRESYIEAHLRYTGGESWVHPEAQVVGSTITRSVIMGPCRIEGAVLDGVVVDEGATVRHVQLKDVLIGRGASIRGEGRDSGTD